MHVCNYKRSSMQAWTKGVWSHVILFIAYSAILLIASCIKKVHTSQSKEPHIQNLTYSNSPDNIAIMHAAVYEVSEAKELNISKELYCRHHLLSVHFKLQRPDKVPLLPLGNCLYRLIIYQSPFVAIGQLPVFTVLIIYQKTSLNVNKTLYSFIIVSLSMLLTCDS